MVNFIYTNNVDKKNKSRSAAFIQNEHTKYMLNK